MQEYKYRFLHLTHKKHPTMDHELEYLIKHDAVCIALFTNDLKNLIMVTQYRVGCDKRLLEVPAGLIEKGEDVLKAALREIREETGFDKEDLEYITDPFMVYGTPAFSTEKMYFFGAILKKQAKPKKLKLDDTEDIQVIKKTVKEALESEDLKTQFAVLKYLKEFSNERH